MTSKTYQHMEKTYGEKMVRSGFNPSESQDVKELKELAAKFIDKVREVNFANERKLGEDKANVEKIVYSGRWTSLACTEVETACMYAVKAATAFL